MTFHEKGPGETPGRGTNPTPLSCVPQETSNRKGLEHSERDRPTSAGVPCSCGSFWWPCWMTQQMPTSLPGLAGEWSSN